MKKGFHYNWAPTLPNDKLFVSPGNSTRIPRYVYFAYVGVHPTLSQIFCDLVINYEYIITAGLHNLVHPVAPTMHSSSDDKATELAIHLTNKAHENQNSGFWSGVHAIGQDLTTFTRKLGQGALNLAGNKAL